jgi:hypothetical protein
VKIIRKNIAAGDLDRFSQVRPIPWGSPFLFWIYFSFFELPLKASGKYGVRISYKQLVSILPAGSNR